MLWTKEAFEKNLSCNPQITPCCSCNITLIFFTWHTAKLLSVFDYLGLACCRARIIAYVCHMLTNSTLDLSGF